MLFASLAEAGGVRVRGYTRKDGTYVAPHYRSAPNSSKLDNYSTRGNYNPYTGKTGTVDPYRLGWPTRSSTYIAPTYVAPSPAVMPAPQPSASSGWRNYGSPQSDYSNPAGIARESIGHGAAYAQPTDEEAALAAVQELGRRLRESDPDFDSKFAMIQPRIQEIQQSLPPEEWASAILIAWPMSPRATPPSPAIAIAPRVAGVVYACKRGNVTHYTSKPLPTDRECRSIRYSYAQDPRPSRRIPATFHGYICTQDCSGHEAGYEWAEDNGITDMDDCEGNSQSFIEGCQAYAEEQG